MHWINNVHMKVCRSDQNPGHREVTVSTLHYRYFKRVNLVNSNLIFNIYVYVAMYNCKIIFSICLIYIKNEIAQVIIFVVSVHLTSLYKLCMV